MNISWMSVELAEMWDIKGSNRILECILSTSDQHSMPAWLGVSYIIAVYAHNKGLHHFEHYSSDERKKND